MARRSAMPLHVTILRQVWLSPLSALGHLQAIVGGARFLRFADGVALYASTGRGIIGRFFARFPALAYTWGAVVTLERASRAADRRLLAHEMEHVRQGFRWGPLFPAAYAIGALVGWRRGHWYWLNPLEVDARAVADAAESD